MEARRSPSIVDRAARFGRWAAGLALGGVSVLLYVTAAFLLLLVLMVMIGRTAG
jgi:hypothetical protein